MLTFFCYILPAMLCGVTAEYYFVRQPTDTHAIEGMSLHLQCKVIATDVISLGYTLHWQLNTSDFIEKTHSLYAIEEDINILFHWFNFSLVSNLSIFKVSRRDEGFYSCNLHRKSGQVLLSSANAQVSVIQKPRFFREPKNVSAIEGGIMTLVCRIQGLDSNVMFLRWTRGDQNDITAEDIPGLRDNGHNDRYLIDDDKSGIGVYYLHILKVRRIDAGFFYCNVYLQTSGEVVLKSRRAMLEVLYPPDEKYPSCIEGESKHYSAGDTLTTECISRGGNGPLRLSWLRNGKEIRATRTDDKHPDIRDMWTLTPADNGGNITCVMKGKAVLNRRTCVIGPLSVYFGPIISIEPKTTQVSIGQTATFKCSAYANPPITAKYLWFLDGEQLDNSNSDLKMNWNEIKKYITLKNSEINVTCAADGANLQISDAAVLQIKDQSISVETTASPKVQTGPSTLTFGTYILVVVLCILLIIIILLVYCCRRKKIIDKPHKH